MNEINVFNNTEFGKIRTTNINGEPWFVGKDVCEAFGDTNHKRSLANIDDSDRRVFKIETAGGKQNMIIINECGLYSLLFQMQPQKAKGVSQNEPRIEERIQKLKRFKHWVTSEVLPSIRKTGSYSTTGVATPNMVLALEDRIKEMEAKLVEKFYEMDLMFKATAPNVSPITYEECLPCFIAPETYTDTRTKCVNLATQIATLWGSIDTQETPYQKIYNLILKKHNINIWSCTTHYNQTHNTSCSPFTVILNSKVLTQLFISTAEEIIDSLQTHEKVESITSFSDALDNLGQLAIKDYNSNTPNLYKAIYKMMDVDWSSYQNTPKLALIKAHPELQSVFVECVNRLINQKGRD